MYYWICSLFFVYKVCSNGTRVYVHKDIWDTFVEKLVTRVRAMKIGDPLDEQTTVGASISGAHANKVLSYINNAKAAVRRPLSLLFSAIGGATAFSR